MPLQGIVVGGQPVGTALVAVPDVRNKPVSEATAELQALGLVVSEQPVVGSGTESTVYDQVPRPPATLGRGALVTLMVLRQAPPPPADVVAALRAAEESLKASITELKDNVGAARTSAEEKLGSLSAAVTAIGEKLGTPPPPPPSPPE